MTTLADVYARIPSVVCLGLCADSCGPVPVFRGELVQIRAAAGRRVRTMAPGAGVQVLEPDARLRCSLLKAERCTVYEARPAICRLFGVADGLRCPHGCVPERVLSRAEVADILAAAEAAS